MKPNFRARCARINKTLKASYGEPRWEGPKDPVAGLIRSILSQNTADTTSSRAYESLRRAFKSWDDLAEAAPSAVARAIRVGGLAKPKAACILGLVKELKETQGSVTLDFLKSMSVREALRALESIDGVGPKTAACVLLFAFGREICPVDTHMHRVLQRMGIFPAAMTAEAAFEFLQPLVPKGQSYPFHLNLIRLGRETCRATRPRCPACPVEAECRYPTKSRARK